MIVKFDSLNHFDIPVLSLCNPNSNATITLEKVILDNVIGQIKDPIDLNIKFNFNAPSELSFQYDYIEDDDLVNGHNKLIFDGLLNKRYIYVEDYGYFIISEVSRTYKDGKWSKKVTAYSSEKELDYFTLPYLATDTQPILVGILLLLQTVLNNTNELFKPRWTVGHCDTEVSVNVLRSFGSQDNQSIYNFLIKSVQVAYDCILEFDCINRQINIYSTKKFTNNHRTSIHVSMNNFLKSIEMTESTENMYTALEVTGSNDLNIMDANPIGTNIIYNFDYYSDWMSPHLKDSLQKWQTNLNFWQPYYVTACKNGSVVVNGTTYTIEAIRAKCVFSMFLNSNDLAELSPLVYQKSYTDEYITITDNMTISEKVDQANLLMTRAEQKIKNNNCPPVSFSIDTEGFIFNKEFKCYAEQLESGCLVFVEVKPNYFEQMFVLNFDVNFSEQTLKIGLGNKYNKKDLKSLYDSIFESNIK